jgi:hypothetical protein
MKLRREHFMVAGVNMLLGIVPFFLLKYFAPSHPDLAKAAFYIGITPTAAAAPVVVSFLNGRTGFALTGFMLSYAVISAALFLFLPMVSGTLSLMFLRDIFFTLFQLVFLPYLLASAVRKIFPEAKKIPAKCKTFTFSLWSVTLFLMSATSRMHFINNPDEPLTELRMKFSRRGVYTFRGLTIIRQPMEKYPEMAQKLGQYVLEDLDLHELAGSGATNRISGRLTVPDSRLLCIQIPCCRGMQAYVDGKKTPLLQADTMFCAVKVDEGTHEIELRYRTPGMAAGACISIAALLIIIAQEAAGRLRKKELRKKKRL